MKSQLAERLEGLNLHEGNSIVQIQALLKQKQQDNLKYLISGCLQFLSCQENMIKDQNRMTKQLFLAIYVKSLLMKTMKKQQQQNIWTDINQRQQLKQKLTLIIKNSNGIKVIQQISEVLAYIINQNQQRSRSLQFQGLINTILQWGEKEEREQKRKEISYVKFFIILNNFFLLTIPLQVQMTNDLLWHFTKGFSKQMSTDVILYALQAFSSYLRFYNFYQNQVIQRYDLFELMFQAFQSYGCRQQVWKILHSLQILESIIKSTYTILDHKYSILIQCLSKIIQSKQPQTETQTQTQIYTRQSQQFKQLTRRIILILTSKVCPRFTSQNQTQIVGVINLSLYFLLKVQVFQEKSINCSNHKSQIEISLQLIDLFTNNCNSENVMDQKATKYYFDMLIQLLQNPEIKKLSAVSFLIRIFGNQSLNIQQTQQILIHLLKLASNENYAVRYLVCVNIGYLSLKSQQIGQESRSNIVDCLDNLIKDKKFMVAVQAAITYCDFKQRWGKQLKSYNFSYLLENLIGKIQNGTYQMRKKYFALFKQLSRKNKQFNNENLKFFIDKLLTFGETLKLLKFGKTLQDQQKESNSNNLRCWVIYNLVVLLKILNQKNKNNQKESQKFNERIFKFLQTIQINSQLEQTFIQMITQSGVVLLQIFKKQLILNNRSNLSILKFFEAINVHLSSQKLINLSKHEQSNPENQLLIPQIQEVKNEKESIRFLKLFVQNIKKINQNPTQQVWQIIDKFKQLLSSIMLAEFKLLNQIYPVLNQFCQFMIKWKLEKGIQYVKDFINGFKDIIKINGKQLPYTTVFILEIKQLFNLVKYEFFQNDKIEQVKQILIGEFKKYQNKLIKKIKEVSENKLKHNIDFITGERKIYEQILNKIIMTIVAVLQFHYTKDSMFQTTDPIEQVLALFNFNNQNYIYYQRKLECFFLTELLKNINSHLFERYESFIQNKIVQILKDNSGEETIKLLKQYTGQLKKINRLKANDKARFIQLIEQIIENKKKSHANLFSFNRNCQYLFNALSYLKSLEL